jgi:hypothetical protein
MFEFGRAASGVFGTLESATAYGNCRLVPLDFALVSVMLPKF